MQVKELIEHLEKLPQDLEVYLAGDSYFEEIDQPEFSYLVEISRMNRHSCFVEITEGEYEDWKLDKTTLEHETHSEPFKAVCFY
jgi:hypothetical protein